MVSRETTAKPSSAAASSSSQEASNSALGVCQLETPLFSSSPTAASVGQQSPSPSDLATRKRSAATVVDSSGKESSVEGSPRKRARLSASEENEKDIKASPLQSLPALACTPTKKNKTKTNKKKKKKFSCILKNMLQTNTQTWNLRDEREALRKGLGGGNFEKVAKI